MNPRNRAALLDALAEASSAALVGISADGDILTWNSAAETLLGWTAAEVTGQPSSLLVPVAELACHHEAIAVLRTGGQVSPRRVGLLSSGQVRTEVELSLTPVRDDRGKLQSIAGHIHARADSDYGWRQLADAISVALSIRAIGSARFGYWNRAFTDLLRLDPAAESVDMSDLHRVIHPDDRSVSHADIVAAEAGGYVERELRTVRPDGTVGWIRATIFPLRDAHGRPVSVARTMADITERKAVEFRLTASDQRFRQLADAVSVGFTVHEVGSTRFTYANRAFFEIIGSDRADFAELARLIHPDDRHGMEEGAAAARAGTASGRELRIVRPDGQLRWVYAAVAPILDRSGTVVSLAGTMDDITDRKAIELALLESEQRFVQLAASLRVGVSLRQVEPPLVLYVNPRYIELIGSNPLTEFGGEVDSVIDQIHPDDLARFHRDYWQLAQTGQPAVIELRMLHPSGKVQWLRLTSQLVAGRDGPSNRAAGTIEDITERKLAEAGTDLARHEAEQANAAKTDFLSRMSHELRTPLNAVLGFAQLLELDSLTSAQSSAVEHILRGGRHLLEMINDVLDIARIESDQLAVSLEPVSLADLILDSVGLIRPLAAGAGVAVHAETVEQLGVRFVSADRRRMRQVLLNLLSNAIKYNRPGGQVDLSCVPTGDGQISIRVSDTGRGIRDEDQSRLFIPFERLGEHLADVDGTGIGLALSQRLMSQMGGTLTATSSFGVGSVFTATLNLVDAVPAPPAGAADAPHRPARLLYLDDNPENIQLLQGIVGRRTGWVLQPTTLEQLPVVLTSSGRPDLVVIDGDLGEHRVLQVLARLHVDVLVATIPVAVLAVEANPSVELRLRQAGALHYLAKPVRVGELLALLDLYSVTG